MSLRLAPATALTFQSIPSTGLVHKLSDQPFYWRHPVLRFILPLAISLCLLVAGAFAQTGLRAPSVPLVTCDPYYSIWSPADHLNEAESAAIAQMEGDPEFANLYWKKKSCLGSNFRPRYLSCLGCQETRLHGTTRCRWHFPAIAL